MSIRNVRRGHIENAGKLYIKCKGWHVEFSLTDSGYRSKVFVFTSLDKTIGCCVARTFDTNITDIKQWSYDIINALELDSAKAIALCIQHKLDPYEDNLADLLRCLDLERA